jgi:D-amino peptidase
MKKIYMMTDLEGVAGVLNFEEWAFKSGRYYDQAKEFLTREVNAAAAGLFDGGAEEIMVSDGHGDGGINPGLLDPRVELLRGWPNGWPLEMDKSFDGLVFVGQHAKAGSPGGHLCHTQSLNYIDFSINGASLGEFGQLVVCANELKVRTIFASGDAQFANEARKLVPGIETVAVKRGVRRTSGDDLNERDYTRHFSGAIHVPPERSRKMIYEGALRAITRAKKEKFGLIRMKPPYKRVIMYRPDDKNPTRRISRDSHPRSVIALLNMRDNAKPIA